MQFSVCSVRTAPGAPRRSYVVVLQHDDTQTVGTKVVAPLATEREIRRVDRLHPRISVRGEDYFIAVDQVAAVPVSSIGPAVASAEHLRDEITRALDLLFTGF